MKRLPTVDGYTVDERLKQFRKMEFGREPEFIDFNSEKGEELLEKYECCKQFCNQLDEWILDEEKATKEYKDMSDKADGENEMEIGVIFDTLSIDEGKHAKALKKLSILKCGREF